MSRGESLEYQRLLDELSKVVTEKAQAAAMHRVELRDAVCIYVTNERARGTTIEAVIDTVTEILRKAGHGIEESNDELVSLLVDWCIEFHSGLPVTVAGDPILLS